MPNGNKPTRKSHYISRMYYKGFSEILNKDTNKAYIWQYDLKEMKHIPEKQINTDNICYKKDLYELKDFQGNIIFQNLIENKFSELEQRVDKVLRSIDDKSHDLKYQNCTHLLNEEEKKILKYFITSLKFRDPYTIHHATELFQENNSISKNVANNFTLLNLLPLQICEEWDDNTIIKSALRLYDEMDFKIGIASDGDIITSDRPVIEWPPDKNELYNKPRLVILPLTSRLVLYMFPKEIFDANGRNCFFIMDEDQINDIQINVAVCANNKVFSRFSLSENQIKNVNDARKRIYNNTHQ